MKKTKPIINCLVLAAFLLSASGCEWDQPLSPSKDATVDPKLLGNWKARYETDFLKHIEVKPDRQWQGTFLLAIGAIKDVAYAPQTTPANAMCIDAATQYQFGNHSANIVCWPTRFKDVSYLNYVNYDFARKNLGKHYSIVKYEATDQTLRFYMPKKEVVRPIKKRLGSDYNSTQLLEEFSKIKPADWILAMKCERIKPL